MHKKNILTTAAVFLLLGGFLFFACEQPSGQEDENTNQNNESDNLNEGEDINDGGYEDEEVEEEIPPPVLTGISVTPPDTLIYARGQAFDAAGMVVEEVYDNGTTVPIDASKYTLAIDIPDMSVAATKVVTITAHGFIKRFQITVRNDTKVLQSIAITRQPNKTAYEFGQEL